MMKQFNTHIIILIMDIGHLDHYHPHTYAYNIGSLMLGELLILFVEEGKKDGGAQGATACAHVCVCVCVCVHVCACVCMCVCV